MNDMERNDMERRREMRRLTTGLALAWAALATSPAVVTGQETVRLEGDRVGIWNLAGEVEVVRGSGSDVVVRVTRGGSDREQLRLETGPIDGRSTLRVVYPAERVVYEPDGWNGTATRRVRADGTFGRGRGGEEVRISSDGSGLEAHADLRVEVPAGKDVSIYLAVGGIGATDVSSNLELDTGSGQVEASGIRGRLGIDTGSGSVRVRDVEGSVEIDTGSGSVRIEDVRGDRVMVDTGSGSVRGGRIEAGSLEVDTGSGAVDLDAISSGEVAVDTGSGSVELTLLTDVSNLDVDTGSGGVTLRLPPSVGAEVDLDTGSGGIDIDLPLQLSSVRRDHVVGTIGDGDGRIRVDTGSGGIRLLGN